MSLFEGRLMAVVHIMAVQLRTLEEAFPNLMVVGSRLWIELAFHLNGREKTKTPLSFFYTFY